MNGRPAGRMWSIRGIIFSRWSYRLIRCILAVVFLWAGVAKLSDPKSFAGVIEAYGLIPQSWTMLVAVGLPTLELIAGLGLLLDIRGSLGIIGGLLLFFMGILTYGILIGLGVDCGCFGAGNPETHVHHGLWSALYRDLVMMGGVIYLYLWRYRRSCKPAKLNGLIGTYLKRGAGDEGSGHDCTGVGQKQV